MATGDPTVGVNFDANAADLAGQIDAALQKVLAKTARDISKVLSQIGRDAAKNVNTAAADKQLKATSRSAEELRRSLKAIGDTTQALQGQFGKSFDPKNVAALDDQLRKLAVLQQKLKDGAEALGDVEYDRLSAELKAVSTGVIATRESFLVAARASDEMRRNIERNARQASRVQVQESKAAAGRYVVDAQSAASAARDTSRQQIEATKAASRQRVATIQAAARTIATIERGLSAVFRGTANAIGSAFRGIGTAASGVATGIGSAFRKANTEIINNTSSVSNAYSTTFKKATNTVRNETRQQASVINNFAREAKASIGSISSGATFGLGAAVGGILGVGFAKALTGGFQRATILENSERALTKLLGTAEEAKKLLTDVTEIVTGTPFALDQFAAASTQLLAFNVEAKKIPEVLRTIADAAALSLDPGMTVDRLVRTFGQIQAAGKLATEDINQLTEAGVPAWALLGNQLGKTTLEMRDLVTEGAVPATQAIDLLLNGIQNWTEGINGTTVAFAGLSKELGSTLKGSVSNFFTSISRLGANIITAFREPFTAALGAATAAVDLLGSALKALAEAIQASPTFQLLQRGLVELTKALKTAKVELAGFFAFISGGIVLLAQLAGAFLVFKNIPGALRAVGSAIKFVLAPQRLLIAGAILVASYFKKLYDESKDLRTAMGEVGAALGRIATVVKDLAVDAFSALTGATAEAGEAAGGIASDILGVVVPALQKLADFLVNTVLPPIRNFAKKIREDVLPAIGGFLADAIDTAVEAFQSLVQFIQDEVVPVVGPILARAVEIGQNAFDAFYEFASGTLVPFLQNNLVPVLAGVGAALGVLALTGGNIPLAGLAGVSAALVAVLSNDDIRNALVENLTGAIDTVKEKIGGLFDGETLKAIGIGVLKAARKIGQVLGDIFTDPRVWGTAAAIAAAAAAVAAAFLLGLGEGLIKGIPDLLDAFYELFSKGLQAVVGALFSDPKLLAGFAGLLGSAAVIASFVRDGRRVGQAFGQAVQLSAGQAFQSSSGTGVRSFTEALFGGRAAFSQSIANEVRGVSGIVNAEVRRIDAVLSKIRGPFISSRDAGETQRNLQLAISEFGPARVGAQFLRSGISDVGRAIREFGSGSVPAFQSGIRSIGQGLKLAGREIATGAGVIAGGAFAASFVSQALFDINSSGKDKLQSALGTIAIGAATGAQFGDKGAAIGAGAGLAVAAVGFLTTAFRDNDTAAKDAAAALKEYETALSGVSDGAATLGAIRTTFRQNLEDADGVAEALGRAGFKYEQFQDVLENERSGGSFLADVRGQLLAADVDAATAIRTLEFLEGQLTATGDALDSEGNLTTIFATTVNEATLASQASDIAGESVQYFRDRVTELNDARIDGFRAEVNEAKGLLDQAGSAADQAKEKLRQFLAGETGETTIEQSINNAIIATGGLASSLEGIDLSTAVGTAEFDNAIAEVKSKAGGILADVKPVDATEAANAVAELKTAITESGADQATKDALIGGIDAALANYSTGEGQGLLTNLFSAENVETDMAALLATAQTSLDTALAADPLKIPLLVATAKEDTEAYAADLIAGITGPLDGDTTAQAAMDELGKRVTEQLETTWQTGSPSKVFETLAGFAVDGLVKGLGATLPVWSAGLAAGKAAMAGLNVGLVTGSSTVYTTIRSIGARMIAELKKELVIESPSKVTEEIGEQTVEGFIVGIDKSLPLIDRIAFSAATKITSEFEYVGERAAQAIGIGFAEEGAGFAGSVASALDDAFDEAMTKTAQFKVIGQEIAKALFAGQGTTALGVFEGGPGAIDLEQAFLSILGNASEFQQAIAKQVEEVIGKDANGDPIIRGLAGFTTDISSPIGQANRSAFLEAGIDVREYGAALLEGGRSVESAVWEMQVYRDQIIALAQSFAFPAETIDQLIHTLGLADDQLAEFVATTNATAAAAAAAAYEAELAISNQEAAEKAAEAAAEAAKKAEEAWEEAGRAAEKAAQEAEDRAREEEERKRREYTLPQPVFRDLIIQSPSGDPEAVALAAANRVAFSIRR